MTKEAALEIWSPPESPWSRWAKPVLFAFLDETPMARPKALTRKWNLVADSNVAIVVDTPGEDGVILGIALARAGYRPIPIYNACPFALTDQLIVSIFDDRRPIEESAPVVNLVPTMSALHAGASSLANIELPASAPPAFLIDADRRAPASTIYPGAFDNRSVVSALDFPSSRFLLDQGIARIVLVARDLKPQPDLLYVLLAWQVAGLTISWQEPWREWNPEFRRIKPPFPLTRVWHKAKFAFGYHRDEFGQYGRIVRASSS